MANILHLQRYADLIRNGALRRERVVRDRAHPLDAYDDVDFKSRYRLRRATVMDINDVIRDDIQSGHDGRNQDLTPTFKTLLVLRFYATGSSRL